MAKSQLRDQVRVGLTADVSDRAKILWAYLYVCAGGQGRVRLADALGWTEEDFLEIADELIKLGLVSKRTGQYTAKLFVLPDVVDPDAPSTPPALAEKVDAAMSTYNAARREAGAPPVFSTADNVKRMTQLVDWLRDQNIPFESFLKFAQERTAFMRKEGMKFIPLNTLSGDWVREQWAEVQAPGSRSKTEHAGKAYTDVVGIREQLVAAGFARAADFKKWELRAIIEAAQNMVVDPQRFPEPPDEFRKECYWVKRQIESGVNVEGS